MEELKKYLSDDQVLHIIQKVEDGRKLEAARSLQYYLIGKMQLSLPYAISLAIEIYTDFYK